MTLIPAYGRDYKSKAEVQADLSAGKDFTVASVGPEMGRRVNIADLKAAGVAMVMIRYAKERKIQAFKVG
jgi:hypothetical protein